MTPEILLWAGEAPFPKLKTDQAIVCWAGRDSGPGIISLEEELDKRLLQIRQEHMRWAFETGFLPVAKGKTLADELKCGDAPSMWWTSLLYERHPKLSPFLFDVYKLRCLELLLLERRWDKITVLGGTRRWRESLRDLCCRRNWQASFKGRIAPEHKATGLKRVYLSLPATLRACLRYLRWLWLMRRKLPFAGAGFSPWLKSVAQAKKYDAQTATIVTYFPNIDLKAAAASRFRSRYWESLHDLLNKQAKHENPDGPHFVRWLFIYFSSPDLTLDQCLALRNEFQKYGRDGLSFNYLEEFLTAGDLWHAILRWLKISFKSFSLKKIFAENCHFQDSRFNFWPWMREQWAESFRGWRCLERCLQNRAFRRYFILAGKQRWNLFPLENCPWERMLTQNARAAHAGQPVYGAQHSMVRPADFRYFDDPRTFSETSCLRFQPDIIGGNGQDACGQFSANGMPPRFLRKLEALRYLYLAKYRQTQPNGENLPPQAGEPLAYNGPNRLLVVTSFFADETAAHLKLLEKALDKSLLKGWHITIKPHPYLSVDDWLDRRANKNEIRLSQGPLEEFMTPGVLVWASNSTTAALDAILRGLAVMVMRPCGDFDLCPVQNVPGLIRTGNVEELASGLKKAAPLVLAKDYLDLDESLSAWRKLLNMNP